MRSSRFDLTRYFQWIFNSTFLSVLVFASVTLFYHWSSNSSDALVNSAMGETLGNQLARDVHNSISTLKESVTLRDWLTSGYTPDDVFKNALSLNNSQASSLLCDALNELEPRDLVIFEDTLNNYMYQDSFGCTRALNGRLAEYWQKMKVAGGADPVDVQVRKIIPDSTEISSLDLNPGEFALVFEGNLDKNRSTQILQALQSVKAKALFLVPAQSARKDASLFELISRSGQTTGSQGSEVEDMTLLPTNTADKKLSDGDHAVSLLSGNSAHLFSFPMASVSSGDEDPEYSALEEYTRSQKMILVKADLDSEDWKTSSPAELAQNVSAQISQASKGIIVLHSNKEQTALALPAILKNFGQSQSAHRKLVVFSR